MKFCGTIGFWFDDAEIEPGRYAPRIEERPRYRGDVLRNIRKAQPVSNQQNDDITVSNQISIISDLYLQKNWPSIRYVVWNGVRWRVTNVEVGYPRIILDVGGVYNGPTVENPEGTTDGSTGDSELLLRSPR